MELMNLWSVQGQLLLLLLAGVFLSRIGFFNASTKAFLTDLVIFVTLPCSIVLSFMIKIERSVLSSLGVVFLSSLLIQLFCYGLSKLLYRSQERHRRGVLRYGILVSNSGFMGFPVASELFGPIGLMYASVYLIPQRILVWTAGLSCFVQDQGSWRSGLRKIALHPGIISVYIGMVLLFFQIGLPSFIERAMRSVSACTTPLSMILIGAIVGEMERKDLKIDLLSLGFSAVRLVCIPLAAYLGTCFFSVDPLVSGVSVVLAGMPIGSTTAILAAKYGGDASFASRLMTITTILSMLTIPLWAMVV